MFANHLSMLFKPCQFNNSKYLLQPLSVGFFRLIDSILQNEQNEGSGWNLFGFGSTFPDLVG